MKLLDMARLSFLSGDRIDPHHHFADLTIRIEILSEVVLDLGE